VHPTVLTLIWAHETMYCTRSPAGEIDRGTADFLFCLPVSRWSIYLSETIGWILSGGVMLASGFSGHLIASGIFPSDMRLSLTSACMVLSNLSAVYLAVGGFAFLVSAISDRRGRAIGVVFAVLLASFLLNFLAQFTDWARAVSPYLSLMEYYRPAIVIQSGQFPVRDVAILGGLAAVLWTTGGVVFHRRSVCTV
jgi:ABC-2 type transport system permease protein